MKFNVLNRKIHYWASIIIAFPILIIIISGIFLQLKKQFVWIQPAQIQGSGKTPTISFQHILETARTVSEAEIKTWDDINRLDIRPSLGMLKLRSTNNWEIQIDVETGEILKIAYRRSDLIESVHDGSFFHDSVKMWIFLPSGIILLILWITGMYLFVLPVWRRKNAGR